jgi:hypothetical protein
MAHGAAGIMLAGIARRSTKGVALPGNQVQVSRPGALNDHQLAGALQRVLQFMDALAADIDIMVQGGIGGPGDPTAIIGVNGQV